MIRPSPPHRHALPGNSISWIRTRERQGFCRRHHQHDLLIQRDPRSGAIRRSSADRLRRGAPDILTPWATRGRIDFSNPRCPSLSIPRVLARPPACMLAMSPLGGGKTTMTLDFAWSLDRAHTSAGRVRCVHNDLACTLLSGVLSEKIVLLVHSNRQRMRRGVDQNSLPETNARCAHVAMHTRSA